MTPSSRVSSYVFSEEDLGRIKKNVLVSLRQKLVESIDPRHFLTMFRQQTVVNGREYEEIKCACSRSSYEGTEKLLDVLMTKGSRGYDVFCLTLLNDQTQLHLLQSMEEQLEKFKYNFKTYVERHKKELDSSKHKLSKTVHTHQSYPAAIIAFPPKYQNSLAPPDSLHRARSPMSADEQPVSYPAYEDPRYHGYHMYMDGNHTDAFHVPHTIPSDVGCHDYAPAQVAGYPQYYESGCQLNGPGNSWYQQQPTVGHCGEDFVCGQQGH